MEELKLPVFEKPVLPVKPMPWEVWQELNTEFVRRLKARGEYARFRASATCHAAPVRFQLR
jgi:hypothetical protein